MSPPTRIWLSDGYVDLERREVVRGDDRMRLTPTEHLLLSWMAESPGMVVSQETLLEEVWGYGRKVRSRTVYTTIQRLRKKLEIDSGDPTHLVSVYGSGYRLDPAESPVERATDDAVEHKPAPLTSGGTKRSRPQQTPSPLPAAPTPPWAITGVSAFAPPACPVAFEFRPSFWAVSTTVR